MPLNLTENRDADEMLEAPHQEAAYAAPGPMDEDDSDKVVPDSDQQMVKDAQQQQPEAMQEDPANPVVRSVRLQDEMRGGAQGTPKALASTLVSHTLPSADALMLVQPVIQPHTLCYRQRVVCIQLATWAADLRVHVHCHAMSFV